MKAEPVAIDPALARFDSSVRSLLAGPRDPRHHAVEQALRNAADALETLRRIPAQVARLRASADRLGSSDESSLSHADMVEEALAQAASALSDVQPPPQTEHLYSIALVTLNGAIARIDGERPLLDQRHETGGAFLAMVDVVFLAAGHSPSGPGTIKHGLARLTVDARAQLLELSSASWTDARRSAASTLETLASIIAAMNVDGKREQHLAEIRFQAERLRRDDSTWFGHAGWIRQALLDALDALDATPGCSEALGVWTRPARESVTAIEGGSMSFQRVAIQDAFRATVDAFGAASHFDALCRFHGDAARPITSRSGVTTQSPVAGAPAFREAASGASHLERGGRE